MKLLGWVAGLILLLLAVLVSLPFSGAGTQLLVRLAGSYAPLEIDYRGGRLFGELELARLSLQLSSVELELEDVATDLQWRCFWRSTFCFERVSASTVSVGIPPGDGSDPEPEEPPARELLLFPYEFEVDDLQVGELDVRWSGGQWRQSNLSAAVDIDGSNIMVAGATLHDPVLRLEGSEDSTDEVYSGFTPPEIFLPLGLVAEGLSLNGCVIEIGDSSWKLDSGELSGRWEGFDLTVSHLRAVASEWGELIANGRLSFRDRWPLGVEGSANLSEALPAAELRGRALTLSLEGDLDDLGLKLAGQGSPAASVSGSLVPASAGFPFDLNWELAWPEETALSAVLPGSPEGLLLAGPVAGRTAGDLQRQSLELRALVRGGGYESLALNARGHWQDMQLTVDRLELEDVASDSRVTGAATVNLEEGWSVRASLDSPGLHLPPLMTAEAGRVKGSLSLAAEGEGEYWRISISDVAINGTVDGLPASVGGSTGLDSSLRLLPGKLEAQLNGADLSLFANPETGIAQASLELQELGLWLTGARGALSLQAQGDVADRDFRFTGSARDLRYADQRIGLLNLDGTWRQDTQQFQASLTVPEWTLVEGEVDVRELALVIGGTPASHRVRLSSDGDLQGALVLTGQFEDSQWLGELKPASLTTPAGEWRLPKPVELAWDAEGAQFTMAPHCWEHDKFELCGDRIRAGVEGDIQLRLAGNARAFGAMLPRGLRVRGPVEAELQARWTEGSDLAVDARARGNRITVIRRYGMGERVEVSWEDVRLNAQLAEGELAFNGTVNREGRRVAAFQAVLPPERDGALSGELTLDRLKLSAFAPWVTELSELSGDLSGEIQLSGRPEEIQAIGYLALADGHMVALGNPTELTDLQLRLDLNGTQGELTGRGLLGGGELVMEGLLSSAPELRLDLNLRGERHTVLMPPASEAVISEELQLVLKDGLLDVRGDVRVHEGVLRHEELPDSGVSMSSDIVIVDLTGSVIQEERPFEVRSDLALNIRDRFRIETDDFRATLGGNLQLVQEPGRPMQLFGTLNVLGGELHAFRQRLVIQRGSFAFTGPADNPELDISAEREIRSENVTVGARVFGRAQDPELEVYSSPVMSQSEAMSYLVRGRGLDSGAAADGTALALSLGADVVNQSGVVDELNRLPMISNVAFGASGDEDDTAATVSGYVGERLYLSYGIGIYEPINVLTARLYLQSRLWIEVVSRLENSIDLYYSFDID